VLLYLVFTCGEVLRCVVVSCVHMWRSVQVWCCILCSGVAECSGVLLCHLFRCGSFLCSGEMICHVFGCVQV